jgi:hypothetical protein
MTSPGLPTGRERWAAAYARAQQAGQVRDADFSTLSGVEVDPVYGPADEAGDERMGRIGWPGEFPFTRGLRGVRHAHLDGPGLRRPAEPG